MGDYLKYIARKVSGVASAVRPRVPSLFEPPAGFAATRLPAVSNVHGETEGLRVVTEEVDAPAQTATPAFTRVVRRAPFPRRASAAATHPADVSDMPARSEDLPLAPPLPPRAHPAAHYAEQPTEQELPTSHRRNDHVPVAVERGALNTDIAAPVSRPRTESSAKNDTRGIESARVATPSPGIEPARTEVSVIRPEIREVHFHDRPVPALGQAERRAEAPIQHGYDVKSARPMPVKQAVDDGVPSVQVVIGRVTVQAVAAPVPAATAPPRPQAPRLSLEDYLKRREGRA